MYFDYLKTSQYQDSIEIESIGNCTVQALNDEADCWVLIVHTVLGWTTVIQAGPINLDFDEVRPNTYISRNSFEYNEKKLYKIIHDFMNNPKRTITSVEIIDEKLGRNIFEKILNSL